MLKSATLFKDFKITADATNTSIKFVKNGTLTVNVKNDNFSEQVQIYDNLGTTYFFIYKYITFDNKAVFEIKDCIQNEKFTTLFIQYLSNITFDVADTNFYVDGVSVNTLQKLGFDINKFAEILDSSIKINTLDYRTANLSNQDNFLYAVKIRLSQYPENLNYRFTGYDRKVEKITGDDLFINLKNPAQVFNASLSKIELEPNAVINKTTADTAKTVIVPIPLTKNLIVKFATNGGFSFSLQDTLNTLSKLITDLTLSVEIIFLSSKSLFYTYDNTYKYININILNDTLTLPSESIHSGLSSLVRTLENQIELDVDSNEISNYSAPIFLVDGYNVFIDVGGVQTITERSLIENLNYLKLKLVANNANTAYLNINILGNVVDISKIKNNYIYLKKEVGYIRVYVDIEKNIYKDIITSIEFAKNAYSNFDAYKKSNIELLNNQKFDMLKQQQSQKRSMQDVDNILTIADTLKNASFSAGLGSVSGAIGAVASGGLNILGSEMKLNLTNQNEKANLKLLNAQALETSRYTITPSEELKGSISLTTALKAVYNSTANYITPITLSQITISTMQLYSIQKYVFDNFITEKVTNISQLTKPTWQTLNNFYQVKIKNKSPINTRKDLIIFVENA